METQLSFKLPVVAALGRDDFMIAPSNSMAVCMIETPMLWEGRKLILSGPEGSGKTHLSHVWQGAQGGRIIAARDMGKIDVPKVAQGPVVIEDLPEIAQNIEAQTALFHLHNMMQTLEQPLLITGRGTPNHWNLSLPDLQSRINAAGLATLAAPDDSLLGAVIAKQFNDRQLMPRADLIPYLLRRIDRSFAAARDVVQAMDEHSLSRKKPLTRALAAEVLDSMTK